MSDDLIKQVKDLTDENATLKNQLKTLQANITALNQTFGETMQMSVNLKTNIILFQQMLQEANQKVADKDKVIADQKAEMEKLLAPAPVPATQNDSVDGDSAAA